MDSRSDRRAADRQAADFQAGLADTDGHALAQDGTTMAVAPLTVLAEPGGVLDALEARGLEVEGPEWK